MMEEAIKYAAKVELWLRKGKITDLRDTSFDADAFLRRYTNAHAAETSKNKDFPDERLANAEQQAALSGTFNPDDLFPQALPEKDKRKILSVISWCCNYNKLNEPEAQHWQLVRSRRYEVLRNLIAHKQLEAKLAGPLPATDQYGDMLRRVLKEKAALPVETLNQKQIRALINVLETLDSLDIPKPDISSVKSLLEQPGILKDYKKMAADFVGRAEELDQLQQLLKEEDHSVFPGWRGMVVTGEAGIGKSALLAKFIAGAMPDKVAAAAVLDFNRPGMDATDIVWLANEISRQVAEQHPALGGDLADIRAKARNYSGKSSISNGDMLPKAAFSLLNTIRLKLMEMQREQLPFLLVLDNLEKVAVKDDIGQLLYFIESLAEYLMPPRLKVIFAGRLQGAQLEELLNVSHLSSKSLEIRQFDEPTAISLMRQLKVRESDITRMTNHKLIPLYPSGLRHMAQVLGAPGEDFNVLCRKLREYKDKHESWTTLLDGILYEHTLRKPARIRKIICYGTLFRYLTPGIISHVLAPALDLNRMTEQEAAKILAQLSDINWLTHTDSKGRAWFHEKQRNAVCKLMRKEFPVRTASIRKNAIAYFNKSQREEEQAEAIYHELMLLRAPEEGNKLSIPALKSAASYISPTLEELPAPAQVLLKYASGQTISHSELHLLPAECFRKAYHNLGKDLMSDFKYEEAYNIYKKGCQITNDNEACEHLELLDDWENEALFVLGHWDNIKMRPFKLPAAQQEHSLLSVLHYVFPMALIAPANIDRFLLEEILTHAAARADVFGKVTQGINQAIMLSRLTACFTILHHEHKLTAGAIKALKAIVRRCAAADNKPGKRKSLLLLGRICGLTWPEDFFPGISLLRLNKGWLKHWKDKFPAEQRVQLGKLQSMLDKSACDKSVRQLLMMLDETLQNKEAWHAVKLRCSELSSTERYELLRGPDAFFRNPCRYALRAAFSGSEDTELLVNILKQVMPCQTADLNTQNMTIKLNDNSELALEPFIEIIDRAWKLGHLLELACHEKPADGKLQNIFAAYNRWQEALRMLVKDE